MALLGFSPLAFLSCLLMLDHSWVLSIYSLCTIRTAGLYCPLGVQQAPLIADTQIISTSGSATAARLYTGYVSAGQRMIMHVCMCEEEKSEI